MIARILVVEDNPTQAELARALLATLGHEVRLVGTAAAALEAATAWAPDAVLLDIELPDYDGLVLMRQMRAAGVGGAIIVVTMHGSINTAVEAMRGGAVDFIVKPYSGARLSVTLANAIEKRALERELQGARAKLARGRFFGFVGASPQMQAVYRTIESVAASRASVFVTGESGTGKELAAEAIHKASPRAGHPFVALNCGAIPRDLLESEVFGHVRGAFTGATTDRIGAASQADGGTLFLDEIGELPPEMQVKLLRFVQTGQVPKLGAPRTERVDVRFVCATNRDPAAEVAAGRFREDLFYRLYVVPIELPPLRQRGDDVLTIARHFLAQFSREEGRSFRDFTAEAAQVLANYGWPGNVRQLQNVVRNVVVLHDAELVERTMLPPLTQAPGARLEAATEPALAPLPAGVVRLGDAPAGPHPVAEANSASPVEIEPLATMERRLIQTALAHTDGDVGRAAALLQVNASTIYRKLQNWRAA